MPRPLPSRLAVLPRDPPAYAPGGSPPDAGTAAGLLETKLHVPRARGALVARPRLVERIREGRECRLTLVVAPAGSGKTTLLASWLADPVGAGRPVAWVSLDASENEPALFWEYVLAALRRAHPALGTRATAPLHAVPSAVESALTALINDVTALDEDCVLVLDDYHVVEAPPIHDALAFLLDHLPQRMRVVIASRAEPPLPLARLRARGELAELRTGDLRFTPDETAAFLNDVMSLGLSAAEAASLERRTEGWIAGLKLAALSMRGREGGREDARAFVDAFPGDHRYVADYLVGEVLDAEPAPVRRFLLDTAILERMSGPLCDAVAGGCGSQALLEELERRGLFVVALDERREWYRYHHLFADVLRARALADDPGRVRAAHGRASAWHERAGAIADAVRHALGAEDTDRAAALLEATWPAKNRSHASARWLGLARTLPDEVVRARPLLGMGYAWALLNSGDLAAAAAALRAVEAWLAAAPAEDAARVSSLTRELAAARVYLAQARGELPGTVEHAQRALEQMAEGDLAARATGTALLALARWARGELALAHRTFADALALMGRNGDQLDVVRGTFVLGDLRAAQGRLREAAGSYEEGLRLGAEQPPHAAPEVDELHLGLSEVHREWGDLDAAAEHLRRAAESAERAGYRGKRQRWCTAMARLREAQGDVDAALALLGEAEAHDVRDPIPRVRPIAAMRARLDVARGRLAEASDWARQRRLSVEDELSYAREYEHVTLARVLVARHASGDDAGALRDAARLLERLLAAAEEGGRTGSAIEILLLQSLARRAQGDPRGATQPLARALTQAEPEGFLRVFVDEGGPLRELLRQAVVRGVGGSYAARVLAAFETAAPPAATPPAPAVIPRGARAPAAAQALTARELEVLRLIAAGLRNQEIADRMAVAPATVKRHVANAYGKLGARHRTEALARARELRVL
ncbi:LuxR C-terminal-related transcriptional regulator [Roseisolibacter sp. H3M3-2]|uniref:LuxR C-terminal-related transcriptional regulator n=1 Tax=Roseisolibacter sp. H3M3-2 TaxID=3031323 RepID=UPI0023DC1A1B|nr:LuxR C-terminal-related transcriptional regulator [Roseisolibacter sp. H3M3-2]MDF1502123.1 LuxR C-terminal-related transcriptional regulator [Roseisolibacter sp. H3M3-2]